VAPQLGYVLIFFPGIWAPALTIGLIVWSVWRAQIWSGGGTTGRLSLSSSPTTSGASVMRIFGGRPKFAPGAFACNSICFGASGRIYRKTSAGWASSGSPRVSDVALTHVVDRG